MSQGHQCTRCGAEYASEQELQLHLQAVHRCPNCGMLLQDHVEREAHLAKAHGQRYSLDRDFSMTEIVPGLADIPGWRTPKEQIPDDPDRLYEWLVPICELIARAKGPEKALEQAPIELKAQVEYVRKHFDRVTRTLKLERYRRLRDNRARAAYLVIALAHLDCAPSYALQLFKPSTVYR